MHRRQRRGASGVTLDPEIQDLPPKRRRWRWFVVLILIVLGTLAFLRFRPAAKSVAITSFQQCVDQGYPVAESDPATCTVPHGQTFVEGGAKSTSGEPKSNYIFDTLVISPNGPAKEGTAVIRNQADWAPFWNQIHAYINPPPPLLAVDFTKQMVAVVMMGARKTAGYRLAITNVYEVPTRVIVEAQETKPAAGCLPPPAAVAPYHIVTFQKTDKPIVFDIQTTDDTSSCGAAGGKTTDPNGVGKVGNY
jgi:hypothetical protein